MVLGIVLFHHTVHRGRERAYTGRHVLMYRQYMDRYGRVYSPSEYMHRMDIFIDNIEYIDRVNGQGRGYRLEINGYADREIGEIVSSKNIDWMENRGVENRGEGVKVSAALSPVDWSVSSYVGVQGHQQGCFSCYAFTALNALEHRLYARTGERASLSVQEIIDCSSDQGNDGCNGGWMHTVYDYVLDNSARVEREQTYPYTAAESGQCNRSEERERLSPELLTGYKRIGQGEYMDYLMSTGPIPSGINIMSLLFYKEGIFSGECEEKNNHAVLTVGIGQGEGGQWYLKVKNSWGSDWGENGYFRIALDASKNNALGKCGLGNYAVVPQ